MSELGDEVRGLAVRLEVVLLLASAAGQRCHHSSLTAAERTLDRACSWARLIDVSSVWVGIASVD